MEQNFGLAKAIIFQNSESLFKTNQGKRIIKEYMSIIRDSKILLKENSVYNYIESQIYSETTKDKVVESIGYLNNINKKQLKEEHNKIFNLLKENNIVKISDITNEKLYEDIDDLIFMKKSIKFINEKVDLVNSVVETIKNNKIVIIEEKDIETIQLDEQAIAYLVNNFNEKYADVFNEEQKALFESISSTNESDQIVTFEKTKKECLDITNEFLKEAIDNETKAKVLSVKEKLLEDKFSKHTFIEDMLKYITLKEALGEE